MNSRIIRIHFVILLCFNLVNHTYGQDSLYLVDYDKITTGADQIFKYTPQLKNKRPFFRSPAEENPPLQPNNGGVA